MQYGNDDDASFFEAIIDDVRKVASQAGSNITANSPEVSRVGLNFGHNIRDR